MHRLGQAIWLPIAAEGATMQMMLGNGFGFNWQGKGALEHTDRVTGTRPTANPGSRPV